MVDLCVIPVVLALQLGKPPDYVVPHWPVWAGFAATPSLYTTPFPRACRRWKHKQALL